MARLVLAACVLALLTRPAGAEGWEIAVSAGRVFPFYKQSFTYDPGALASPIGGATLEQRGAFRLDARGGLALNLSIARRIGSRAAVVARLDTADVQVDTTGAQYRLQLNLPAPLPPISTDVDLGTGTVDLERLKPLSLDVEVHTGKRLRVAASAGPSWLPAFRFVVNEGIGVGLPGLGASRLGLDVGQVTLSAEALPTDTGQGRFGVNAGMTADWPIGRRASVRVDGRYFRFQKQTLQWGRATTTGALPAIEEDLVRQVESRLEPVVFNPTFFHASAGVALRF